MDSKATQLKSQVKGKMMITMKYISCLSLVESALGNLVGSLIEGIFFGPKLELKCLKASRR